MHELVAKLDEQLCMTALGVNINCCGNKTELAEIVDEAAELLFELDAHPIELSWLIVICDDFVIKGDGGNDIVLWGEFPIDVPRLDVPNI